MVKQMSKQFAVYEYAIEVRDGEHEYSERSYLIAEKGEKGLKQVERYAKRVLKEFFGEGSHMDEDGNVWDETCERAAKFDGCGETWGGIVVSSATQRKMYHVMFQIMEPDICHACGKSIPVGESRECHLQPHLYHNTDECWGEHLGECIEES